MSLASEVIIPFLLEQPLTKVATEDEMWEPLLPLLKRLRPEDLSWLIEALKGGLKEMYPASEAKRFAPAA